MNICSLLLLHPSRFRPSDGKPEVMPPAWPIAPDKRAAGQKIGDRITLFAAAMEDASDSEEQTQTNPENDPQTTGS
jgi:hypothetical protein